MIFQTSMIMFHVNLQGCKTTHVHKHQELRKKIPLLGDGWTNPFQKYARQIGSFSPGIGVKIKDYLKPPPSHLVWVLDYLSIQTRWRSIFIINLSLFHFSTTTFSSPFLGSPCLSFSPLESLVFSYTGANEPFFRVQRISKWRHFWGVRILRA